MNSNSMIDSRAAYSVTGKISHVTFGINDAVIHQSLQFTNEYSDCMFFINFLVLILTLNPEPHIDHDPPFDHLEYLCQFWPDEAQNL
jgi:hypothetical protein